MRSTGRTLPKTDHKPTPADVIEDWRERVAIMEVDGGLDPVDAAFQAWERMDANYPAMTVTAARLLYSRGEG